MKLLTIVAILIAVLGVAFALQNNISVTVSFFQWRFAGSLAMALLLALASGAVIVALLSAPATLRARWQLKRQRRTIAELEAENADLKSRVGKPDPEPALADDAPPPYVGLKTLVSGRDPDA